MKALISPEEISESGFRVAEVTATEFDVAPPLFWVDCANDIVADRVWYDSSDQTIKAVPEPEAPVKPAVSER